MMSVKQYKFPDPYSIFKAVEFSDDSESSIIKVLVEKNSEFQLNCIKIEVLKKEPIWRIQSTYYHKPTYCTRFFSKDFLNCLYHYHYHCHNNYSNFKFYNILNYNSFFKAIGVFELNQWENSFNLLTFDDRILRIDTVSDIKEISFNQYYILSIPLRI